MGRENVRIPVRRVLRTVSGYSWQVPDRDPETGTPRVRPEDEEAYASGRIGYGEQRLLSRNGSTIDLMRGLLAGLPRWAQRSEDIGRIGRVAQALDDASDGDSDAILLRCGDYEWLMGSTNSERDGSRSGVIDRRMPPSLMEKAGVEGDTTITVAMALWGTDAGRFREYLKSERDGAIEEMESPFR